jgi:DnaJ-class molecular chaperone
VDALESITGATREVAIGTEDEPQRISVHIPAQIEDGGEFTFDGKQNGQRAVFKAKVTVVDHPFVSRRGLDLTFRVPISIQEAIQGTTVSIPYSNGPLEINIPPQKGLPSRITLPKRGLRDKRSSKHGDLNIDPIVTVPDVESEVVKEAAKAMEAFYKTPVRSKLPKN